MHHHHLLLPLARVVAVVVVGGGLFVASCRNTIVEVLGDAGPADAGGGDGGEGDGEGEGECPQADAPALSVHVIDGTTSLTLCTGVTVTVSDGAFTTTATPTGTQANDENCRHVAATGRPGTYTITATGAGFSTASLDNLVVAPDDCGNPAATREVSLTLSPG